MMSDVVEKYRNVFTDAYAFHDITNKPTLITMLNPNDRFWIEYNERKLFGICSFDSTPTRRERLIIKDVLTTDLSMAFPFLKFIRKAINIGNKLDAEYYLLEMIGDVSKYNFPLIDYITSEHYTNTDVKNLIIHLMYEEIFNVMKKEKDEAEKEITKLKMKKRDLYSCINSKTRKIVSLQRQLKQLKNKIRYVIDE